MNIMNFYLRMRQYFFALNIFLIALLKFTYCETCIQQSVCQCKFSNGSFIDLTSLGYHDKPRWESVAPPKGGNFTYFYNPCYSFKLGLEDCGKGVAVCQVSVDRNEYHNCGDSYSAKFSRDSTSGKLQLIYSTSEGRVTTVTLQCSYEHTEPKLEVLGEPQTEHYAMTLTSICACPNMCHNESHLSAGSVLVIIFMIFVALYLVLGIIHSSLTRGAHGWELIPHYEFWADFPLLVRDGCVFVVNGCKAETAYERI